MPFHSLSLFFSTQSLLRKINRRFQFDLIDGHYIYPDGLAAVLLGKALNKPVIRSARGSDIHLFPRFKLIKPMIRYALNSADHAISVCNALKQEMISLGIRGEKITVVPNGIDTKRFYFLDKNKARGKLMIPLNTKIILSVGNLIPLKGFHKIIETLPKLLNHYPHLHLYIIGEGPYRSALEQKVASLNLINNVTLVGSIPNVDLRVWYSAADVFCLASSREGWANVIMESLACGTPVVATQVDGAPEVITTTDVGILVNRTPESIGTGLNDALSREWDSVKIRKHVNNRTWLQVAAEVKSVFSEITNNKKPKQPVGN